MRQASHLSIFCAAFTVLSLGCAAQTGKPAEQPDSTVRSKGAQGETSPEEKPGPRADVLYPPPHAVPALPASCRAAGPLPRLVACEDRDNSLAEALLLSGSARDEALSALEACSGSPPGLFRALRAELGPAECADALVEAVVGEGALSAATPDLAIPADIRETLVALGLGARLARLAHSPPQAPKERTRDALDKYFKEELFPWISEQAQAIFEMASQGTHLSGYARGIVAIEAGSADMRFVEIARNAPLAEEIAAHQEAKDLYYATLDERLEPRKARGRDAALAGLREMARLGVRSSRRVEEARALLSKVYGGRRVNALDTLLVAPVPPVKAEGAQAAIASRVPTAYAPALVGPAEPNPLLVRAHLQMGMPEGLRRDVEYSGGAHARLLLARALFENGRTYFRAQDFQAVHAQLTALSETAGGEAGDLGPEQMDEVLLLKALALALSAGPVDATDMIAKGPRFADSLGNLVLLDELATEKSELGGRAAFNAAYLRELVAPEGAPAYWADLGARYLSAAKQLKGDEAKMSRERGNACREIERALRRPR
jgi:hypothetical protein